jgi:Tfp pilus assembly protein PilX
VACRRLLRDEQGVALVLAIITMLVLTIVLTTVIFLTAAGARDAQRSNAAQRAYALAESGINNALAVLNANYPGSTIYPGNASLLPARTSTYSTGSVAWAGALVNVPANPSWKWEWDLTATSNVKNPTGPAADVTRTATAVVPVVIPASTSIDPSTAAIDFVYALNDISFGQTVSVASPVYAGHNLTLTNSATVSQDIPASATGPARKNKVAVVNNLSLTSPQNQVGQIGTAPAGGWTPAQGQLAELHVQGTCASQTHTSPHSPCDNGDDAKKTTLDTIYAVANDAVIPPGFIVLPHLTCCAPVTYGGPVDGTSHPASPSYMGFWYQNADLGPNTPCAASSGTPPMFDNDGVMNQSAYAVAAPFNLTGSTHYTCRSASGTGVLSWDGTTLTIKGTIFIDGSICSGGGTTCTNNNDAIYVGKGTIILTGTFSIFNHDNLCVNLSGGGCNTSAAWNPDTTALAIVANGDFGNGDGIEIKQGQIQGLLLANKNVFCDPAAGTLVQGPMVAVYGSVSCGQAGTLSFPAISFASSGTDGLVGPLPLPQLLPPVQFGGG